MYQNNPFEHPHLQETLSQRLRVLLKEQEGLPCTTLPLAAVFVSPQHNLLCPSLKYFWLDMTHPLES
jgi:hypothetical protein